MPNLEKLHSHFLHGNITQRASGKTTAVIYQAIGFMEVLHDTNIYILCQSNDIRHIHMMLSCELQKRYNYTLLDFPNYNTIKFGSNTVKIKTFDDYMNNDYMSLNHSPEDHMILFDYRNVTSVNTSPLTIFKIMGRTIGEVVAACGHEVNIVFGGLPIDIYID